MRTAGSDRSRTARHRRRSPGDDGRCAIDAEAYFRDYQSSVDDAAPNLTMAVPAVAPSGGVTAEAMSVLAWPEPPVPGPLDDNVFVDAGDSRFVPTAADRESTFALDVDTGSFHVAGGFLAEGYRPEPDSIRPEEWINAFDYGDPPATGAGLALGVEGAFLVDAEPDVATVRIGVSTRELDPIERPSANITFVVDTSGSMDIRDRLGLVQSSLALLVRTLRPDDTIAIVTYGSDASSLLAPTPVAQWRTIVAAIDSLAPDGSTNMEAGLLLGYQQARRSFDPDDVNVVVLASDGVANQGVTDPEVLTEQITQAGDAGIHLVTVGYGMGNYNDHLMEQLADRGDGFYSYIDDFAEAERLFVDELTPTLTVVAEQAKVQVVFDPDVVTDYRLIGYENRMLDDAQFVDDTVDAGELGAGHQVSAVYELRLDDGVVPGDVAGTVALRWEDPDTGAAHQLDRDVAVPGAGAASPSLRLAALVAGAAEVLKGNSVVVDRGVDLATLAAAARSLAATGDAPTGRRRARRLPRRRAVGGPAGADHRGLTRRTDGRPAGPYGPAGRPPVVAAGRSAEARDEGGETVDRAGLGDVGEADDHRVDAGGGEAGGVGGVVVERAGV